VARVLVVEDEESFSDALSYMLRKEGFEVSVAATGTSALTEFDRTGADIVLLDLMLPEMSGTEVCRQLRTRSHVPIIMVTARDSEIDKVVGLEIGADDYVTKPYSPRELVARIRAVLRRQIGGDPTELAPPTLSAGPVRMDVERHVVTVSGGVVPLPLKEFELLEMLLRNAGRVLTRGQLIDRVWGADYVGDTKTLDVHVKRRRIGRSPARASFSFWYGERVAKPARARPAGLPPAAWPGWPGAARRVPACRAPRTARGACRRRSCRRARSAPAHTTDRAARYRRAPPATKCTTSRGRARPRPSRAGRTR